jgi:DNA-binding XRE family transcriptional regulator
MLMTNNKRLQKLHDLNQTEFANRISISPGSLSDLGFSKSKLAIETVISICSVFTCSFEWLVTGKALSTIGELTVK